MLMRFNKILFAALLIILMPGLQLGAQQANEFLKSNPEREGVSPNGIYSFLSAAGKSKHELHSFIFLRHGKIISEGWWDPYRPLLKHSMYSVSKSFTSTAVGFAVSEKLIAVNDKVISFFPQDLPDTVSSYLSELTIKDLLTMSVGQEPDPTFAIATKDSNWVKGFLSLPIKHRPGSKFLYNSMATYMLSAIVQKATGQKLIDYLKPRFFKPLGIEGVDWETDANGINTGGWGLRVKTEDMAKLGQFYLQKGMWKGTQLLPKEWVEEATTIQIEQQPDSPQSVKDSSDWLQGYGYKFWRCRHHCFRADGAFGQFIIMMPDQDAVIAITSETSDMQSELNLVWEYLLPAMHEGPLPLDKKAEDALKAKLHSLRLAPAPYIKANPVVESNISGKKFILEPNEKQMTSISFQFRDHSCHASLNTNQAEYKFAFGEGKWEYGETKRHGPNLLANAKGSLAGLPPFKVAGSYRWADEHSLELVLRYIESPHTEYILCRFDAKKVSMEIRNSFEPESKKAILRGDQGN